MLCGFLKKLINQSDATLGWMAYFSVHHADS
jgi:hypothetical protein